MKRIADMTKGHESVRFIWFDKGSNVIVFEGSGTRTPDDKHEVMTKEQGREHWTALEAKGFIPVMVKGRDATGNRLGTLPDGKTVTEFPGGGWVLHVPGTPNLYNIVGQS